jgi:ribosomal protein S18 acetylase RimI-like enzyme
MKVDDDNNSRAKRPSKEYITIIDESYKETPDNSELLNSMEMISWKDNTCVLSNEGVDNLILETKLKCSELIYCEKVTKSLLNEMKLHFKLLLKSPFPDDFYKKIENNELQAIIGLDKVTEEPTCFAVINNHELINNDVVENEYDNQKRNNCCIKNNKNKCWSILAFAVVREYQRIGLGSKLMEKIVKDCETNLVKSLNLIVQYENHAALSFYKKHKFRTSKILNNYYEFGNEEENRAILMTRNLSEVKGNYMQSFLSKLKAILLCRNNINNELDNDITSDDEEEKTTH